MIRFDIDTEIREYQWRRRFERKRRRPLLPWILFPLLVLITLLISVYKGFLR